MDPLQGNISPYADLEIKEVTVSKTVLSFSLKANCPSVFQTDIKLLWLLNVMCPTEDNKI